MKRTTLLIPSSRSTMAASAVLLVTAACAAGSLVLGCAKAAPEKAAPPAEAPAPVVSAAVAHPIVPPGAPQAANPAAATPGGPAGAAPSDLPITWTTPSAWAAGGEPGPMQKARYLAPPVAGDKEGATITVFYFGQGMGGSVEANIERWIGQFKNLDRKTVVQNERNVAGFTQHIVEIPDGTFEAGMMPGMPSGEAKDGWGMLGAVVESSAGEYFFKLVGPKHTVAGNKAAFYAFLESIKKKP